MKEKRDKRMNKGMTGLYLLLTLVGGLAIFWAMIKIQWVHGDEWRERGSKREVGMRVDPARRGNIYSSDGKILATTVTVCDLYLDLRNGIEKDDQGDTVYDSRSHRPKETGSIADSSYRRYIDTVCLMLHQATPSRSKQHYLDRIGGERAKKKASRCFLVQRGVPYSVWLDISRLPGWRAGVVRQVDGRSVVRQERAHIYGNMAGNTIGFRNQRESRSFTGLEGAYDSILRGQDGIFNLRRLTKGIWLADEPRGRKEIPQRTDNDRVDTLVLQNRIDGMSIVSTLDTRYQDIAESSLRKALEQYGGTAGCALLMEMQTGYVLACANLAVDTHAHTFMEVKDRNVAVSDVYEPGSTFKTVILTAMLNDPAVKIDTAMKVQAFYKNFGGKYGEIKDSHKKHDSLTVKEVMEESSNVGMCELGWKYYNHRRDTLRHLVERMFPYGKLNPDVVAREYKTYVNDLHLSNRDFLNFCYGYSTRVSALQLLTFYNALGAEGRMVKPQFCKGVMKGEKLVENGPIVINESICSRESARMMRALLESVVENGTGNNIKNSTYGIAGKTGTAVHSYANRHSYNASFCGFFPSENPRYTCLVVLENIPYYGRQAALVFKNISDCVVAVDKRLSEGGVKSVWPRLEDDSTKARQHPVTLRANGKQLAEAYNIVRQPYTTVDRHSRWVTYREATDSTASGYYPYYPSSGTVAECYGMTAKDAVALLQQQGYRVRVVGYGKVCSQSPKGGAIAKKRSLVTITLK